MTLTDHALFLAFVALASVIQNLTGFAFGLVLLGLVAVSQVAPLAALTHVVSVLVLVNAAGLFLRARPQFPPGVMGPTLAGSLLGVLLGAGLLVLLSQRWLPLLQALLALTILLAALQLLRQQRPQPQVATPAAFAGFGLLGGLLGGLFSTAGPPLVYHFYRQPLALARIRDALVTVFAVNALLRLGLLGGAGQLDATVLLLSAEAFPVVWGLSRWMAGRPAPLPEPVLRRLVCALLVLTAAGLAMRAAAGWA
ncbi:MAG: TSUP family transporter [Inhella sp.]